MLSLEENETGCAVCWFSMPSSGLCNLVHSERRLLFLFASQLQPRACPHALLAAVLAYGSRIRLIPPDVLPTIFRKQTSDSQSVDFSHVSFKQVGGHPMICFPHDLPVQDLSPLPFHTGVLKNVRLNNPKKVNYC